MKKKFFLLFLLLGMFTCSYEPLRDEVGARIKPYVQHASPWIERPLRPFITPIKRYHAHDEIVQIMLRIRTRYNRGEPLPHPGEDFIRFLQHQQLTDAEGLDPWGVPYQMTFAADSLYIVSVGPDRELETDDDVRLGMLYPGGDPSRRRW